MWRKKFTWRALASHDKSCKLLAHKVSFKTRGTNKGVSSRRKAAAIPRRLTHRASASRVEKNDSVSGTQVQGQGEEEEGASVEKVEEEEKEAVVLFSGALPTASSPL